MNESPTRKQMRYIQSIANELGIEFTGTTKQEAIEWLSENIPKHKEYIAMCSLEYEANMSDIENNYGDWE